MDVSVINQVVHFLEGKNLGEVQVGGAVSPEQVPAVAERESVGEFAPLRVVVERVADDVVDFRSGEDDSKELFVGAEAAR